MKFYRTHKRGVIGTIVFHTIVLLMLIFLGFFTPLPLPGEEGILVNFGNSEQGLGESEPSPRRNNPKPVEQVKQEKPQQEETPPPQTTPPPPQQKPEPEPAKEVAMTQDFEKTAAIDAAEKKKQEEERIRLQKIEQEKRKKQEIERKRLAEIERQRQAELERQRKAELERQRQAEAERKKKEAEERQIADINSRAQDAFSNSGSGSGGQGNSEGKSQGATFPGGNQGSPTGDPSGATYGQGGSRSGEQGSGPSYSLAGRSANLLPRPKYPGNDEGTVVVKITVDKYGKVTAAEPGARGTTIMNQSFWNEAKQAALKANFNRDESAPAFQQGTITYRFMLD